MFVVSDQNTRANRSPKSIGLFLCPRRYGDGSFASRKGDPGEGSDSVNGHRFLIGHCQKFTKMNNLNPASPMSADQIIEDLLLQDDPQRMRMLLRGMADNYLLEESESSFRRASWDCYMALDLLLQRVELLRTERERRAA